MKKESLFKFLCLFCASLSVLSVILICVFLFYNGIDAIKEIGFFNFIFGKVWSPLKSKFGIFPMIVSSVYVTLIAIILGVPVGIFSALYLAKYCKKSYKRFLEVTVSLLASIPSVVFGFFGLIVLTYVFKPSLLCAGVLLAIMILPTIIEISKSSISAVKDSFYEGALALGATKEQSLFKVVLIAAKSGIITSVILAIGRAIGETMAVIMVAGNQAIIPSSLLSGCRTLTANIVLEMGYATDIHRDSLIACGVVLLGFIILINIVLNLIKKRGSKN